MPEERGLTTTEKSRYRQLDKAVRMGIGSFVIVGMALKEISDKRLYRGEFATFPEYLRDRHEMAKAHAYRLMDAATTVSEIEKKSPNRRLLPTSEWQVRPLLQLPLKDRPLAWEMVTEKAQEAGEKITARLVSKVVDFDCGAARARKRHRTVAADVDRSIGRIVKMYKSLGSRTHQESFVEKLKVQLKEFEKWLDS
jgi:hypothetical protein